MIRMGTDELEIIQRSQGGDLAAFELLLARYENKIYSIAYRFMGNHADASDLAQEAFIKIYQGLSKFRGDSGLLTWMYHVTANVCRDELRRRQRSKVVPIDTARADYREPIETLAAGAEFDPEDRAIQKEMQTNVQILLDSLPDDYRLVLIMRELLGFSYEEIAQHMDCSLGTVKSRLSRAREALRKKVMANQEIFKEVQVMR